MQWTESQFDAISAREGTVLVSAAAGSGKTAVLVQRAIERLTDPVSPTPANRMLIVTFTKAAAAEMRSRLERRLFELMRENPSDRNLRRQSVLMHQAHIGTVDSFCAEMAREFFHLLDLSPDFKILSDKREEEMMNQALEEAVGSAFDQGWIYDLADAFTGERDDRRLGGMVLTLYRFMQSHPFPKDWLEEKVAMYEKGDPAPWEKVILSYTAGAGEYCAAVLSRAMELCGEDEKLYASFFPALSADRDGCLRIAEAARAGDWDLTASLQRGFAPARRGALRGFDKDDPSLKRLENCRKQVKNVISGLDTVLCVDRKGCTEELLGAAPLLGALERLTLDFEQRYREKKREKSFLDYSDLEHCAIELFCRPGGGVTPAAMEVRGRFDEIMIDEYQDINEVQDSIFKAVSHNGENLFMVGDVKQSIYGFRRAMPEIFLRAKASFDKYDRELGRYPAYIVLERNFRSRREVTDTVNFVFSNLMSREAGDIDYTGEERLVCGAGYEEKPGCCTEVTFITRGGEPAEKVEAEYIARRIKALMAEGFTVTKGGAEKPVEYGDFCVLLRSANKYAHVYAQELGRLGIPARASVSGGFFAAAEVQAVLSLLRVIDNPNQDIPLLSVLMSPLYGFSAGDAAQLRCEDRSVSIYISLCRRAQEEDGLGRRCAKALEELRRFRNMAATTPSDVFLTLLYGYTGYTDIVQCMDDGAGRVENLRLLRRYAQEYESSGYHGLSGFVGFLDRLRDEGAELSAAELKPAGGDHVNIMSIHKSKGLQFPVCIVAGCGRNFIGDQAADVVLHPELGLGVKLKDQELSARYSTTAREAIALENARAAGAEELRVLYVAMTRAQEKLIMVSSYRDVEPVLDRAAMELTQGRISPFAVRRAKNAGEWMLGCALRHPDGFELRKRCGAEDMPPCKDDYSPWEICLWEYEPQKVEETVAQPQEEPPDMELYEMLKTQADFVYPYEESVDVQAKVSASKLSAGQGGGGQPNLIRPGWLGQQGMTPADRGIALHEFMQFADFHRANKDPKGEIARLKELGLISPEHAGVIEVHRVRAFFRDSLGKRLLSSREVVKERRFTALIPSGMAQPEPVDEGEEQVILQGAVDCTFMENGQLHIIDFKTDRVDDMQELWRRYLMQIKLYAYAMEQVTGTKVGEMILYSTWLSESSSTVYKGFVHGEERG